MTSLSAIQWRGGTNGYLALLDQTRLPGEEAWIECQSVADVWHAIKRLAVRGAPAIGIAAAYGVYLAARGGLGERERGWSPRQAALDACDYLATSRPTAVNLFWALDRMRVAAAAVSSRCDLPPEAAGEQLAAALLTEAGAIHEEDRQLCAAIGNHGAAEFERFGVGVSILTHCNAGALATGGEGTALAVVFALQALGRKPHVLVDETRPLLQGARLTAWELSRRQIPVTLICDSMAAAVMQAGRVQVVITGADRISANGDVANKIGTYGVALAARAHGIPFYVAAPSTTFDWSIASGDEIPIELRDPAEITESYGRVVTPPGIAVYNPAFDVTPHDLITGYITEQGVCAVDGLEGLRIIAGAGKLSGARG